MFRIRQCGATLVAAALFHSGGLTAPASAAPTTVAPALSAPALRALALNGPLARLMLRAGYPLTRRAFPAGRALLSPALQYPLYNFGVAPDGTDAAAPLIAASGSLYGTTAEGGASGNGTVFELTPPTPGLTAWTETILYSFTGGSDGGAPYGSLIFDKYGALYGTTYNGGSPGFGTVFKLAPPASVGGSWNESVLYAFAGGADGANPDAALLPVGGALYSTASAGGAFNGGTAFRLTPPASAQGTWTKSTLFPFGGPRDGNTPYYGFVYKGGSLYSTLTYGGPISDGIPSCCGTVFALTPSATGTGTWTETTIHAFNFVDGYLPEMLVESGGAFYGITSAGGGGGVQACLGPEGCGEVFKLTSARGKWTESVILALDGSDGFSPNSIVVDRRGNLYGSAQGGGVYGFGNIFKLTPRDGAKKSWRVSVPHAFACGADSGAPLSLAFLNGGLYGTTAGGTACGNGQVFQLR
jgi:uncharacterized repeat protein (TIGR03803 family)